MNLPGWSPPPPGYRSEAARRRFSLMTGLLGLLFVVVQAAITFLVVADLSQRLRGVDPGRMDWPHFRNVVYWDHALWYVQESLPRRMLPILEATLQRLETKKGSVPEAITSLFIEDPKLVVGKDRLWIISPEDVYYFKEGRKTAMNVGWRLGDVADAFLWEGSPAVLEERPSGYALTVFRERHWERGPLFRIGPQQETSTEPLDLQVVPCAGQLHLFLGFGRTIHHRIGLPEGAPEEPEAYEPVAALAEGWSAKCIRGEPVLFVPSEEVSNDRLLGYRKKDRGWVVSSQLALPTSGSALGVAPSEDDARFFLLSFIPQGLLLGEVRDGRVGFDAFHPNASATHLSTIWAHFLLAGTAYLMVPVFFAFLTSGMMAQWRTNAYRYGTLTAEFAAMWRRAVAEVADLILVFGPMFAGIVDSVWIMVDPRRNLAGHHFLRRPDLWIFRGMAWSLLAALLFSWLEGRWGVTPGKALAGIRILGTDLQFCGFPRALLRNLLRVVDGLFNFMVGILVTALSENWQRVGDMAARTVVVRARSSGFDAPSDEPVPGESAAG